MGLVVVVKDSVLFWFRIRIIVFSGFGFGRKRFFVGFINFFLY